MATGRIGTTPVLTTRWSKAPAGGTTSLSGLDDNSVSLVYSVGYEAVYRNGVLLSRGNDYTATDGTTITLIDATIAGDIIEVFANQTIPLTDTYSQTVANGKFINNTLTTTTGDIIYASAANTPARLAIGSTDQVLKVSGGVPVWGTAGGGTKNFSLLNAGGTSLSGSATVTISGISNQDFLWVLVTDASTVNAVSNIKFRFNADATSKYKSFGQYGTTTVTTEAAKIDKQNGNQDDGIYVVSTSNAGSEFAGGMSVFGCATAGVKVFNLTTGISKEFSGAAFYSTQGIYTGTSTISSVSIVSSSGNFDAGTIFVYGAS